MKDVWCAAVKALLVIIVVAVFDGSRLVSTL